LIEVPKAIDAEAAVIGAALTNSGALEKLSVLTPDDFADPNHRRYWQGILELLKSGKIPDLILLCQILPEDTADIARLTEYTEIAQVPLNVGHYVKLLREKERGRRLYFALRNAQAALSDSQDYDDIENRLITAIARRTASEGTTTIAEAGDVEKMLSGDDFQVFASFGIPELDSTTGGLRRGEVCILAARTSIGKSAAAIVSAIASAETGWQTLYFSGEMPKAQLWKRMLCYQSRVSLRKFRDNTFNPYDARDIRAAAKELKPAMKFIRVNTEANTPAKLSQLVRIEQVSKRGEYLIVDHAGRMRPDGKARSDYEKMSEIANRLKDMALSLNIPILCLWQLNRGVEAKQDKKPSLADLRDSGQAEEVADFVILLSRDKKAHPDSSMVTVEIAKARDSGQIGEFQIPWKSIIERPRIYVEDEDIPF